VAKTVDEAQVHERAVDVAAEISAIVRRESFRRDPRLRAHLLACSQRVAASIVDGFEQSAGRDVAQFLYRSRAAGRETLAHLVVAAGRRHVSTTERVRIGAKLEDVAKMLTALIARLETGDPLTPP
jgi:four helix bundle protein